MTGKIDVSALELSPFEVSLLAVDPSAPTSSNRAWAKIQSDGAFRFDHLPAKEYELMAFWQGNKGRLKGLLGRRKVSLGAQGMTGWTWTIPVWNPARCQVRAVDSETGESLRVMPYPYTVNPRILQRSGRTELDPILELLPGAARVLVTARGYEKREVRVETLIAGTLRELPVRLDRAVAGQEVNLPPEHYVVASSLQLETYVELLERVLQVEVDVSELSESFIESCTVIGNLNRPSEALGHSSLGWSPSSSGFVIKRLR